MIFRNLSQQFNFGKFKGCDLGEVLMCAPDYVIWIITNVAGNQCAFSDEVIEEITAIFPNFIITRELFYLIKRQQYQYNEQYIDTEYEEEYYGDDFYEEETYERYNGSYAQDEMGYSDDEIDTIFDGDPSAYWNID